ncbi:uncharacterized protein LOC133916335 [Phragmites australis]|uniref:uncharacterized protein LOC133916335 n=1 Tax=Phragmites australis TaxID=29695 RepID=UPI002D775493|nr:uncharacterized protein LOC133916335 [Phragmites australis]
MDPHPTPFPGKRRSVPAPAGPAVKVAAAPKPKSIAAVRAARMAKRSPTGNANAAPLPRPPRRAFGTIRSSNAPADKPPPPQKPVKVSPPPLQKPSRVLPPPPLQKASKLSPTNPVRATKPSRPVAKPLKKAAPGADLEAKARKMSHRVSFKDAAPVDLRSGEKMKASTSDAAGHTPMGAMKAVEKPAKVVAAETPFFSAQNCSSCTLNQLESSTYWLAQIRLAESVGKHWVAAAFFRLAFECQAQPIHRIQSELRSYSVRHESAGTLTPLFDELLTAHGMPVNQPKFDTDGFERVETPFTTNEVDKKLDTDAFKVYECLESDCGDLIDVGAVIVDKHGEDGMDQPSFERKLDESFEFDDCEAVIVDGLDEANFDLQKNVEVKVPCSSEIVQSACRSSIEMSSPRGSIVVMDSSSGRLSLDNPLDILSPSMRSSYAERLSSGSPFDLKSPLSSKKLTSSCPSYKKSASIRDLSSKRMPSVSHSDGEHNATGRAAEHHSKVTQDVASESPALVDHLESKGPVEDAANNEIH